MPIPPEAITTEATFVGQPGGMTFNTPDIAVPIVEKPVKLPRGINKFPGASATVGAVNHVYVVYANIGSDLSPVTRKKAKKIVIATIIVGQITTFRFNVMYFRKPFRWRQASATPPRGVRFRCQADLNLRGTPMKVVSGGGAEPVSRAATHSSNSFQQLASPFFCQNWPCHFTSAYNWAQEMMRARDALSHISTVSVRSS